MPLPESMDEFTRLETFAKLQAPPKVKFKDLEALVVGDDPIQHAADEGACRLHQDDRFDDSDERDDPVRPQGPAVPAEGQYLEGDREHFCAHHVDRAAAGQRVRRTW